MEVDAGGGGVGDALAAEGVEGLGGSAVNERGLDGGGLRLTLLPHGEEGVLGGEGELVDIEELSTMVAGFSDDGRGIQDEGLMREAMGS